MNYLDKFRYSFDNLDEVNTKPKVQKKLIIKKKLLEDLMEDDSNLIDSKIYVHTLYWY